MDESYLNIFLEYVPGGSVATLLRNYGAFEEELVRNWVRQILLGLNYLHERDVIHRDIKGANILVDNRGGIKISDFGVSKKLEDGQCSIRRFPSRFADRCIPGRRAHHGQGASCIVARIRLLDGSRSSQTEWPYFQI